MKPTIPTIATVTLLVALASAAMINVPQTRQEFVEAVSAGKGATAVETFTSDESLEKVYAILTERAATCLDVEVERTGYVGYVERSSSDYTPTVRRVDKERAEFTLQVAHNPRAVGSSPPPGGLYIMAADLKAVDGGMEIVLYRPTMGVKKLVTTLKRWFAGDSAPCPKLN